MLLARLFIKDYKNIEKPAVRSAYGKLAGLTGIVCNLLLCAGKFAAGLISGSVSITADALNNLSDASSGVISLIGFKLSEKSADEEHPYGHARYEYLSGFVMAVIILLIGAELLRSSVARIIQPEAVEFGTAALVVLAVSIAVKLGMMIFYGKTARLIGSDTLKTAAADSRNDVISTSAVLIAAAISKFAGVQLDGIMGAAVALFILYSGAGLVKDAMNPLLGKAPDAETVEKIRAGIMSYEGVLGTHDLMIHDYGPSHKFASVHVEMAGDRSLSETHEVVDKIERDFMRGGLNMLIHLDPIVAEDCAAGKVHKELTEIVLKIDPRLSVHDLRLVQGAERTKCVFDVVVPVGFDMPEDELTEEISRFLAALHPDYRCSITVDRSFAPVQKNAGETEEQ